MRALVVYGTRSGCTAGIAERIGETLSSAGYVVRVASAPEAGDAADYDVIVVGSGVRVGQWHDSAKAWVLRNADALKQMPVALFTCGLMITDSSKADEVRAYTDPIVAEAGIEPVDIGLFAGWNEPKHQSLLERGVMKVMKAPVGDFRDWNVITLWAESLVAKFGLA
ncbi:MAG TPA: flavodoxin domain-containing protein [Coriobacteriia bacterium]|nr:flavodoxin domain-containing protein [Coriobacteriia bacterium]